MTPTRDCRRPDTNTDASMRASTVTITGEVRQFRFAATEEQRAVAVATLDETRQALRSILAD